MVCGAVEWEWIHDGWIEGERLRRQRVGGMGWERGNVVSRQPRAPALQKKRCAAYFCRLTPPNNGPKFYDDPNSRIVIERLE